MTREEYLHILEYLRDIGTYSDEDIKKMYQDYVDSEEWKEKNK